MNHQKMENKRETENKMGNARTGAEFAEARKRILLLMGITFLCLGAIAYRLIQVQVIDREWYQQRGAKQSEGRIRLLPVRGKILDRKGNILAVSLNTTSVILKPSSPTGNSVPTSTGSSEGESIQYIKRKLSPEEFEACCEEKAGPGDRRKPSGENIVLVPDTKRFYSQKNLASHVLGFVGWDVNGYDNKGLEGIEFFYDSYLRGKAKWRSIQTDARRNSLRSWELTASNSGNHVILTLDKNIQHVVESELEKVFVETHARGGSIIVMNPHTGEILAMVNRPDFNPNSFQNYGQDRYRNRAVTWDYEPGSTFKIVQTAGVLEEKLARPEDIFDGQRGAMGLGGRIFRDWRAFGYLTLEDILIHSSNIGAIKLGRLLGEERFYRYIKAFGFGEKTGIDLPGEVTGTVHELDKWSEVSIGAISIGQEVSVTPIQMTLAFATLANGGLLMKPFIVDHIEDAEGKLVFKNQPQVVRRVLSKETSAILTRILTQVVEEGTGKRAATPGYRVAGKTGTAQKFDFMTSNYSNTRLVTSFIGFAPAENPKIVVSVIIDEPEGESPWGGTIAAPVFRRIVERVLPYLEVPPGEEREATEMLGRADTEMRGHRDTGTQGRGDAEAAVLLPMRQMAASQ
ncbi:MAG TPA: penicillin-binding protein 2 [Candidatus Limnocylindrales bacterium]|nr:penicillin-binding protein 2 [Candidatus Limnocylindrales bacterium]